MDFLGGNRLRRMVVTALVGAVFGCSTMPVMTDPEPVREDQIDSVNAQAVLDEEVERVKNSPGPPPFEEKIEPVRNEIFDQSKLFSLFFDDAPLGEVLTALVHDTALNLSVEAGVDLKRPVTVHLKTVTFAEALNMVVVKGADYAWTTEDGCLYIKRFQEKIYPLDYLDMIGDTRIEVGGDMLSAGVEDSGVIAKYQVKGKRVERQTDVWTSVEEALKGLKSPEGVVRVNRSSGLVYLVDTPRRIEAMTRFLDRLSESLHRQVFIEAKIFEVQLNDQHEYGIDWSNLTVGFESSSGALPDVLEIFFNQSGKIFLTDTSQVTATVDFLRTQGELTILSSPHLSVMNGQSAIMTVGYQFPYGDLDGVDRDAETGLITFGTSIKRAILGLQLGLTPQISADGMITLHIVPSITKIQGEEEVSVPLTPTDTQTIRNPVISLQEFATTVRVRSGQSVVLAGLISQSREKEHQGLPWLGSIPWLGRLFTHVVDKEESRELVVFITPHVRGENARLKTSQGG